MNAERMIEILQGIIDDPDYEDSEILLEYLNSSQRRLADDLFLPDLEDGMDTVTTLVDAWEEQLPATYHKGLYMAQVNGEEVNVHIDIKSMALVNSGITMDEGDVEDVCARSSGTLLYQGIPAVAVDITLFYYRLPVDMTESTSSFPDGARGNQNFEWAIIEDAAAKIFNEIEDGMEGAKVNTTKYEGKYAERMALLDMYSVGKGPANPTRPDSKLGWLGAL